MFVQYKQRHIVGSTKVANFVPILGNGVKTLSCMTYIKRNTTVQAQFKIFPSTDLKAFVPSMYKDRMEKPETCCEPGLLSAGWGRMWPERLMRMSYRKVCTYFLSISKAQAFCLILDTYYKS